MEEDVSGSAMCTPLWYSAVPELPTPPVACSDGPHLFCSACNQSAFGQRICSHRKSFLISFPWSKKTILLTHPQFCLYEDSQSSLQKSAILHWIQFCRIGVLMLQMTLSLGPSFHCIPLSCMIFSSGSIVNRHFEKAIPVFPSAHYGFFFLHYNFRKKVIFWKFNFSARNLCTYQTHWLEKSQSERKQRFSLNSFAYYFEATLKPWLALFFVYCLSDGSTSINSYLHILHHIIFELC